MRSIVFILIFSFALFSKNYAQTPHNSSPGAKFTVDNFQGCAPLKVTISTSMCTGLTGCTLLKDYFYPNWDSTKVVLNTAADHFVFDTPGMHRITLITSNGAPDSSSVNILVLPNTAPTFDLYACNGNKAIVNITDTNFETYKIVYPPASTIFSPRGTPAPTITLPGGINNVQVTGNNSDADNSQCLTNTKTVFSQATLDAPLITQLIINSNTQITLDIPLATDQHQNTTQYELLYNSTGGIFSTNTNLYNQSTALINGISTDNNYYCFKLRPVDKCSNVVQPTSPEICSIRFRTQDITIGNEINTLTWLTKSPDNDFTVTIDPGGLSPHTTLQTYSHQPATCGTRYTYQIISNYFNGAKSFSASREATANSTNRPDPINNITASLNAEGSIASLNWTDQSQADEYSIFKNQNLAKKTSDITYNDDHYISNNCYEISFVDQCMNLSKTPNATACPVYLTATLKQDNSVELNWNAYIGWENGVSSYTVEKYTTGGQFIGTVYTGSATTFTDINQDANQAYVYIVKANAVDGSLGQAISNVALVIKDPKIHYPSAFSPDQTGPSENESFKVLGEFIYAFEMQIFNRWGELVFSTTDMDLGWDGTHKAIPAPEGIYAFVARLTDREGRKFTRSGTVVLLRKK
jgi:gliding motility-associated-like protein